MGMKTWAMNPNYFSLLFPGFLVSRFFLDPVAKVRLG
jgi:hypothetical protein